MTRIQRARTADEYADLVRQAVFEVDGGHRFATGELPSAQPLERIDASHCEEPDIDAA